MGCASAGSGSDDGLVAGWSEGRLTCSPQRLVSPQTAAEHPASFVQAMKATVLERRPILLWQALPASYQQDVQELLREFGC